MSTHAEERSSAGPGTTGSQTTSSVVVWLALIAIVASVNLFITFVGAGLERDPRASLFNWDSIAIFGALGLVGVLLSLRTGFPGGWDESIPARRRLGQPFLLGAVFGALEIVVELIFHSIALFLEHSGLPLFNAPFPGSVPFYAGGAVLVETIYRILPVPLFLFLISNLLLRGRGRERTFWVLAVVTSTIEPLTQGAGEASLAPALFAAQGILGFAFNFAACVMFKRYGFLAPIVTRWGHYSIWHILYGNFICAC